MARTDPKPQSPYRGVNVPGYSPWNFEDAQKKYISGVSSNLEGAGTAVSRINEMNQAELTAMIEKTMGPGYAEQWAEGGNVLRQQVLGQMDEPTTVMMKNILTAKAQSMGLKDAGASANVTASGMGQFITQMQQRALAALPGFLGAAKQALVATQTRVESMFTPIQQYAAQSAADNLNVWRQQYAQEQAETQAHNVNVAYQLQEQEAKKVEAEGIRRQGIATRNAVSMSNNAAYGAGSGNRNWGLGAGNRGLQASRQRTSARKSAMAPKFADISLSGRLGKITKRWSSGNTIS